MSQTIEPTRTPVDNSGTLTPPAHRARRLSPTLRWIRRDGGILPFLGVIDNVILPQLAGARTALRLLGDIRPWWAVIGVALEGLSLLSYSMFTPSVLRQIFRWRPLIRCRRAAVSGHA